MMCHRGTDWISSFHLSHFIISLSPHPGTQHNYWSLTYIYRDDSVQYCCLGNFWSCPELSYRTGERFLLLEGIVIFMCSHASGRTYMPWTSEVLIKNVFCPLRMCLLSQVWAEGAQTMREEHPGAMFSHITDTSAAVAVFSLLPAAPSLTLPKPEESTQQFLHECSLGNSSLPHPSPSTLNSAFLPYLSLQTGSQEPSIAVGASLIHSFHISFLCISAPLLYMPLCRLLEAVG